ncbi:hypothetical protein KVR01_004955 [Diaporthe batatas]|uniref:uncharacterized protein n=1 Tax=Diaporthe batatas TaxID=748121 RepID=UPI001D05A886|nr:uncharacterized protein KVR01_004955 [Diaporthe batatas]KAG8164680.1 hypothetical protein KVR01_004955 [Diaporthe batatas]
MVHRAPSTFTATDKKLHAQKRRTLSQGFSAAAIQGFEERILERVRALADQLAPKRSPESRMDNEWSSVQDMSKWASYLAIDVILGIIFGQGVNLIQSPDYRFVTQCIEDCNIRTGVLFQARELTTRRFDRWLFKGSISSRNRFIPFISTLLKARMQSLDVKQNDIFSILLDPKGTGTDERSQNTPSKSELGGECTTLLMAGSETTSTAISATLFYMMRNPEVYRKAAKEVREQFSNCDSNIRLGTTLNSCTYLRACLDESLRLSPPAASAQWRGVLTDVVVDGQLIPAGCDVGTSLYSIQRHPAYFEQPAVFRPERWTESNDISASERAQSAFSPFLLGPRSCVAKPLAVTEAMLTLATLLCRFDLKLAEGQDGEVGCGGRPGAVYGRQNKDEYQLWEHVAAVKYGPLIQFRERTETKF